MFSYSILNTNSSSDHDCEIRGHSHYVLGFTLSAEVKIGEASHVETGVPVIQGVGVGSNRLVVDEDVVINYVEFEKKISTTIFSPSIINSRLNLLICLQRTNRIF